MNSYFRNLTPEVRKAFDDASIEKLVRGFYEHVRDDEELGPIFAQRIENWEPHLQRMMSFWTTVLRGEARYQPGPKGPPPALHRGIEELRLEHFERWLSLFAAEAKEVFPAEAASVVIARSQGMGRALSAHLQTDAEPTQDWDMRPYKTLRFAAGQIPEGLLREHSLKPGVCGELRVARGTLVFVNESGERTRVSQGESISVPSESPHHLEEASEADIEIDFFRTSE